MTTRAQGKGYGEGGRDGEAAEGLGFQCSEPTPTFCVGAEWSIAAPLCLLPSFC